CVFFFQAEDGIRDGHVTGVQTCALPISREQDQISLLPQINSSFLVFPGRSARSEGAGLSDPAPSVAHYANAVILDGEEPNCGMWCEGIIRRTVVLSARVALNLECQSKPAE